MIDEFIFFDTEKKNSSILWEILVGSSFLFN